ncbi:MAG: TraR/DksA C4-type zinc finger protein [Minisyncoccia bacterium]
MTNKNQRYNQLKSILESRREELREELRGDIGTIQSSGNQTGGDPVDRGVAANQDDLEFALIQMKSETLSRIVGALVRLEHGKYGICLDCDEEIAEKRLRALPFADRCTDCEGVKENEETLKRRPFQGQHVGPLFDL